MQETANPIALRYRRMILDAFAALTRTTPYGEITILRIVQEADVSRQTFYRHFRSKDEILAAMLQRIADGVTERLQSLQQPRMRIFCASFAKGTSNRGLSRATEKSCARSSTSCARISRRFPSVSSI